MSQENFQNILHRISLPGSQSETFQDFRLDVKPSSNFLRYQPHDRNYDCIVVQKVKKTEGNYDETESVPYNSELIGSPLKCKFENDYSLIEEDTQVMQFLKNEEEFNPLDLKSARWLISLYNRSYTTKTALPIIILCNGEKENVVLIASKYVENGLKWINVILESSEKIPKIVPKLESLKKKHLIGLGNDKIENIEVLSSYDFSSKNVKSGQTISVNYKWKNPSELYESPLKGCSCELLAEGEKDEPQSYTSDFKDEITILEKLLQKPDSVFTEIELSDLRRQMLQMISDLKKMTLYPKQRDHGVKEEKNITLFSVSPRQLDFTDYVWNFLKNAPKYCHSLITSLLSHEAVRDVKHMIFKTNKTKLAKLIKEGNCKTFCPSEKDSLEILIEIGLEKLQRDYVNFFTASELASKETIDQIFNDCKLEYKTRLEKLKSLYVSLDLILNCGVVLEMPRSFHATFTSQVLKHRDPKSNSFRCQIPSEMMTPLLKNQSPTNWQVSFTSKDGLYNKTSVHQFSSICPIAWTGDANKQWHHLTIVEISDQSLYP